MTAHLFPSDLFTPCHEFDTFWRSRTLRKLCAIGDTPFADRCGDAAKHRPAIEGRVLRLRFRCRRLKDPMLLWVEDDDVRKGADGEAAASFEVQHSRRLRTQESDDTAER